ncbi:TonB-dependent receptor [Caulobacter segnis]
MLSTKGSARARLLTTTLLAGLATVATPVAIATVAAMAPSIASAQDYSSGTLNGTVTDGSGAPVAGASVKVKSLAQGFERDLTTDSDGKFRAALIPIGGYSVAITASGFLPTTDGNVRVQLGGASNYGFTLPKEGEVDAVVVTATANPQLDFAGTTTGAVLDVETLTKQVPIVRNVTALTLLAPSAVEGTSAFSTQGQGQASIGGSSVGENVFFVNGLNITNFINGIGAGIVPFDFYKTVEVKTGGYSAEYGRGTGGFINAVTKSGSNQFSFALHGNYEPNSLRENSPDTFQTTNKYTGSTLKQLTVEASGPIIEDHLFFYVLGDFSDTKTTIASPTAGYYGTRKSNDPFWGVKLDGYITDRQHLELTYFDTTQTREQLRNPYNGTTINTDPSRALTLIDGFGGVNWVGRYTGTFTDWLTLSAAYGKSELNNESYTDKSANPIVQDARSGTTRVISTQNVSAFNRPAKATREFYRGDVDIYFSLFGDHHIRAGFDREETTYDNFGSRNGAGAAGGKLGQNWVYRKNLGTTVSSQGFAPGEEWVELRTFDGGGEYGGVNKAIYIQDSWDITSRLSLNLGLRRDQFLLQDDQGRAFSEFDNEKAARVGFTWDPTGEKKDKIFGFYGRYYLPVAANTAYRAASNNLDVRQYFRPVSGTTFTVDPVTGLPVGGLGPIVTRVTNPTFTALGICQQLYIDRGIAPVAAGTRACNVGSSGETPPPESISALNVKSTMEDEYILGYERRFNSLWKGGVTLTYRTLQRAADDTSIDAAVVAYCKANNIAGCDDIWSGLHQYLVVNPGLDVVAVLSDPLPGETQIRTLNLKASDLGLPKVKREYVALEFKFERAFDGKWGLQGSYVLSESKGNFEGAVKSDTGQADAGITSDFDTPGFIPGTYGLLPNHHAHQLKLFGSYAITDNFLIGGNASVVSPRHYGCQGLVPTSLFPDTAGPSNTYAPLPAHYCQGKLAPRGASMEGDWIKRFDLSLRYTVPEKILPAGNLVLRADVFNLFNFKGAQELYEVGDLTGGGVDPNYGKPGATSGTVGSGYQTPRYVRVGFDLQF